MDKEYIPLLAAAISGGVNALGLILGALVLRHNVRSQANPARVEVHKKQAEVLTRLARRGYRMIDSGIGAMYAPDGTLYKKQFSRRYEELIAAAAVAHVVAPEAALVSMLEFLEVCKKVGRLVSTGQGDAVEKDKLAKDLVHVWGRFIEKCREAIGTDHLTASMTDLINRFAVPATRK